jgi:hypothetical protein
MLRIDFLCDEYQSEYESEYGGIYDSNFIFYDEEIEGSYYDWDDGISDDDESDDDVILEEIPFVYCPGHEETGEA